MSRRLFVFLLFATLIALPGCDSASSGGSSANAGKTIGELCFPGMTKAEISAWSASLATSMSNDDFGSIGIASKKEMKCTEDVAFSYIWDLYTAAAAQISSPITDKDTASTAFLRNWNNTR